MEEFPPTPAKNKPITAISKFILIDTMKFPTTAINNARIIDFFLPYLSL